MNRRVGFFGAGLPHGANEMEGVVDIPGDVNVKLNNKQVDSVIEMLSIFNYDTGKRTVLAWVNSFLSTGSDFSNKNDVFAFWCWQSMDNDQKEEHYSKASAASFGFVPTNLDPFWTEEAFAALKETLHSYNVQGNKKGFEEILHSKLKRRMKKGAPIYIRFFDVYIPEYLKHYETITGVKIK